MPSSSAPLADLLADLGRALTQLGVRWYLFGAQAAILYGVTRLTADVDVTVDLESRSIAELAAALSAAGFDTRVPDAEAFAERTRVLPSVHRATRIPIDLVLAGPGLEVQFFSRVRELSIGSLRIPVASPDDLIVMKLLAGRPKDFDDVVAMLRVHGAGLDLEQIREILGTLEDALSRRDLVGELERAFTRAGGSGSNR